MVGTMSAMAEIHNRRPRRRFTDDFKQQAVRLVLDEGKSVAAVARELDLTRRVWPFGSSTRRPTARKGRTGLTTAEREELARLRQRESDPAGRARHPKKSRGLLREAPAMRFAFIAAEKAHARGDRSCVACCGSRRSGFYAWQRPAGCRRGRSATCSCASQLRAFHAAAAGATAARASGRICARPARPSAAKRVIRLMQDDGLRGPAAQARSAHDDERARPIRSRPICSTAQFDAGRRRISAGSATRREFLIGEQRQAVSGRDPRPLLALRRRAGRSVPSMIGI